jgi:hypothetical protein
MRPSGWRGHVVRESVARFYRSRSMKIAVPVVLLLACVAGWLGYCYVGLLDVQEEDLLSATVDVGLGEQDIHVDLTDLAMREEIARLLNGLHRWSGEATEGMSWADLEVKLRDGPKYYVVCVIWWRNDDLELIIDRGEPDRETPRMWVNSGDMKRFLAEYLGR